MIEQKSLAAELAPYRALFPVAKRYAYLNHAACTGLPLPGVEALARHWERQSSMGVLSEPETNDTIEDAREKMARLIGAQASEIGWVPNTAIATTIVANGIDWRAGDNVVTVASGFPSSVYPWLALRNRGVEVRFVRAVEGRVPAGSIIEAMDARTRALNISWVEFSTGFKHDLYTLGQVCHERGIIFNIDAMQGLGALELDVEEAGVHFMGAGTPKWLMGPHGLGVFYAHREWLDTISHITANWRSVPDRADYLNYEQPWVGSTSRVEGSTPNMSAIVAFDAVLDLIHEVGPARIETRVLELTGRVIDGLLSKGYDLVSSTRPEERSGIVCFLPKGDPIELLTRAEAEQIVIAVRLGVVRVSPHFYNTEEEIDRLLALL